MIRIRQLNLTIDLAQIHRGNTALNRGASADIHKHGRLNGTVHGLKLASPRVAFLL